MVENTVLLEGSPLSSIIRDWVSLHRLGHVHRSWRNDGRLLVKRNYPVVWESMWQVSLFFASGAWPEDASPIFSSKCDGGKAVKKKHPFCFSLRHTPSPEQLAAYFDRLEKEQVRETVAGFAVQAKTRIACTANLGKSSVKWEASSFEVPHLLRALRAQMHCKTSADGELEGALGAFAEYADPGSGSMKVKGLVEAGQLDHPGRATLNRALVRLDCARMLMQRELSHERTQYCYCGYDASPQHGLEMLGSLEDGIPVSQVRNKSFHQVDKKMIERTIYNVACLAGATALDKAATVIHQRWCHHGPTAEQLRHANSWVKGTLSDGGVELQVGDFHDIVDEVIENKEIPPEKLRQVLPFCLRQA